MKDSTGTPQPSTGKSGWVAAIDWMIALTAIAALMYTYIWNPLLALKYVVGGAAVVCAILYGIKAYRKPPTPGAYRKESAGTGIAKLTLLGDDGEKIKEWFIQGETSLLIGKSSGQQEVEIDLADAEYAALISKQHAVLNYASGSWYLEDLDSRNGVGIKKKGSAGKQALTDEQPYKVESGDTIYIANTRLLVK